MVGVASVTITLNLSGLLAVSADTVVYVKVLLVVDTPVNSMFAVVASVIELEISQYSGNAVIIK